MFTNLCMKSGKISFILKTKSDDVEEFKDKKCADAAILAEKRAALEKNAAVEVAVAEAEVKAKVNAKAALEEAVAEEKAKAAKVAEAKVAEAVAAAKAKADAAAQKLE